MIFTNAFRSADWEALNDIVPDAAGAVCADGADADTGRGAVLVGERGFSVFFGADTDDEGDEEALCPEERLGKVKSDTTESVDDAVTVTAAGERGEITLPDKTAITTPNASAATIPK